MPFDIRPAASDDLAAVQAIYAEAVETLLATWDETPPSLSDIQERYQRLTSSGYPFLVAVGSDGTVCGFAHGGPHHPQSGWRFTPEISIYMARAARGQGGGKALLSALIEGCRERGFRTLIAGVSRPGGEQSLRFHQAAGFKVAGVLPNTGFKHGQWLDAIYLTLDLTGETA